MSSVPTPAPSASPSSASPSSVSAGTRRAAVATSAVALVVAALEIAAGAFFWYVTETDTSDDPLVGIGYLFAIVVGVPGLLGGLLGALGWAFARRAAGLALAILAVVCVAGPVLLYLWFALPWI